MDGRPLLVGEGLNRAWEGHRVTAAMDRCLALTGRCGDRLADLAGMSVAEYLRVFDRTNLVRGYSGPRLTARRAREAADELRRSLGGRRVVLLGRTVAAAFGLSRDAEWFRWLPMSTEAGGPGVFRVVAAPHPSGLSRWWSDPLNVARARVFWSGLGQEAGR